MLLLDAVGTLIRTAEPVGGTYARIAGTHGIRIDATAAAMAFADIRANDGLAPPPSHPAASPDGDRQWWSSLVSRVFAAARASPHDWRERFPECFDEIFRWFGTGAAWRIYDDAGEALDRWRGRFRLVLVSNFDPRLLNVLADLGMIDRFESVVLSSEVGISKPAPGMFMTALRLAGTDANRCLHVGDDPHCDVAGASAAGLRVYRVKRPGADLARLADWLDAWPPLTPAFEAARP